MGTARGEEDGLGRVHKQQDPQVQALVEVAVLATVPGALADAGSRSCVHGLAGGDHLAGEPLKVSP